ncbi:MAG TPA: hypothetical protein VK843_01845 [Planctomycetota bacterium]|nr:hypothetical protein [Planctomycetota bacterium]
MLITIAADEVVLEPPEVLVEVVDSYGRPAEGVVVTVRAIELDGSVAQAQTDAEGRVTLAIDTDGISENDALDIGTTWIASTPSSIPFTLARLPETRSRLTLDPSGSIEVVLVGGEQFPFDRPGECCLNLDTDRCAPLKARKLHDTAAWLPQTAPTILFQHVGLEFCFDVTCRPPALEYADVRFDGPRIAGERLRVEVPFTGPYARITGRLIDATGVPLASHSIEAQSINAPGEARYGRTFFSARTDTQGRFVASLRARELDGAGPRLRVHASIGGGLALEGIADWPGQQANDSHAPARVVDLGDLLVASLDFLASGRVVDARGKPPELWRRVRFQLHCLEPDLGTRWHQLDASLDRNGQFRIGGTLPVQRFELRARVHGSSPSQAVEVVRGGENLLLVLREGCWIKGQVLRPEEISIDDLDFTIRCVAPLAGESEFADGYETFEDGRFKSMALMPGTYSVAVDFGEQELARREAVLPEDGAVAQLEVIDLRELIHAIHIQVVAEGAARIEDGSIHAMEGLESSSDASLTREGTAILASLTKTIDVIVNVPGFQTARFDGVSNGAVLPLERGFAILLRIVNPPQLPSGQLLELELELETDDPVGHWAGSSIARLDAFGLAAFTLPSYGHYTITAGIRSTGARERTDIVITPVAIDLAASKEGREFILELEPNSLQAALAKRPPD